jgi:hypothetical protein
VTFGPGAFLLGAGATVALSGVKFNEEAAACFPYDKYLPINRRLDGSVHDW